MADEILDPKKHPEWEGERTKLMYTLPSAIKLWEQYAEIRADSFRRGSHGVDATEFYRQHQLDMDVGAAPAWPERFNPDEISAVQYAMNLRMLDERAFFAEYQNEPMIDVEIKGELTTDDIAGKVNRKDRGQIPVTCNRLTAFIDLHATLLYWLVAAWEEDFTGYVVDYGVFPSQSREYFAMADARPALGDVVKGGAEGQVYAGLAAATTAILDREWTREGGTIVRVERCLIDANWGTMTDLVYQFVRQSQFASVITPSHGIYVGAGSKPMDQWNVKPGDKLGCQWYQPAASKRIVRHVIFDSNYWKTFIQNRLAVPMGDRGCLSLFGGSPNIHRLLADHLTSEYRVKTTGRGRTVDEWKLRPERGDNHWLDCLVGCAGGAPMGGVALEGMPTVRKKIVQKICFPLK